MKKMKCIGKENVWDDHPINKQTIIEDLNEIIEILNNQHQYQQQQIKFSVVRFHGEKRC